MVRNYSLDSERRRKSLSIFNSPSNSSRMIKILRPNKAHSWDRFAVCQRQLDWPRFPFPFLACCPRPRTGASDRIHAGCCPPTRTEADAGWVELVFFLSFISAWFCPQQKPVKSCLTNGCHYFQVSVCSHWSRACTPAWLARSQACCLRSTTLSSCTCWSHQSPCAQRSISELKRDVCVVCHAPCVVT